MVKIGKKKQRRVPLDVQIANDHVVRAKKQPRQKYMERERKRVEKEDEYLDKKTSEKILKMVEEQIEDEKEEHQEDVQHEVDTYSLEEETEDEQVYGDEGYEDFEEDLDEMNEEDRKILETFMKPRVGINLAEKIMEKIKEKEESDNKKNRPEKPPVNPKIAEVFQKVGELLSRYRSGKLPKAFKILPTLKNWEQVLEITHPERWTPNATFEATKIFVSNLKPLMAQQFISNFLLPAIRGNIFGDYFGERKGNGGQNRKLNVHLYMALKKALYKPSAWFKGILFPLLEEGCTLKEAVICGSVLAKASVPVLHSSAALLKIAELEYSGASSIFIRILLDKKYALPFRVVDALVEHFVRVKREGHQKYPVLWHQSLLVFVQRYKQDLTAAQKEEIIDLITKYQHHPGISPEVKRELLSSKNREEEESENFHSTDVIMEDPIEKALMIA